MSAGPPSAELARQSLRQFFGFSEFLPGQQEVIERLLAGRAVLAVFPTGAGKSLCYQLPAMLLDGLALVISPLIALMKDQLDFLAEHGLPAARLDSSLDREATLGVYDDLASGRLRLLYVSPERLNNERFLQSLRRWKISMLAVDEAHCISEWGHNFRPDYLKIAGLAKELGIGRVLTLTATATPAVARDVAEAFAVAPEDVVNTGFYRPNLKLAVTPCTPAERTKLLLSRLEARAPGPAVVYVTLQRTSEKIAGLLCEHGYQARAYHAGMESSDRDAVQNAFMASDRMIVAATIAFGMGVDKRNIRYVYHYNLPKSLESYSQEIGRAGRDGNESICEMFATADDVVTLENFSYGDTPTPEAVAGLVRDVLGRGEAFDVSIYDLSGQHDVRPLVVRTLLTYLELDGVIRATGPFYTQFRFQPQRTSREILARFDRRRADFLRRVFGQARKGKTWFALDVDEASRAIGEPRDRVVAALTYLEEQGDLIVEAAGVRQGYRAANVPSDLGPLERSLARRFERREQHDVERIRRVLAYAEEPGCLTRHLLAYFGESHDDCGHCARCLGAAPKPLPPPSYRLPDESDREALAALRRERHPALAAPRQMARFLCGLSSPAATRAKLHKHAAFGRLGSTPFHEVLRLVEQG
jgi:ATP-dependent DNA helicase RecQ